MSSHKKKVRPKAKAASHPKGHAKVHHTGRKAAPAVKKPASKKQAKAPAVKKAPPAKKPAAKPTPPVKATAAPPQATAPATRKIPSPKTGRGGASKKASRRSTLYQRRGPNGELITPGDLLLSGGPQTAEEVHYFFRGAVAAEHPVPDRGVVEIMTKRGYPETDPARKGLDKIAAEFAKRFDGGAIEAMPPGRPGPAQRRTFLSVVERAKQRRREIGAFLRGLHLGSTETSHMDSHGEASLHNLMEWSARIENLIEAEEPTNADYTQFHRGLDHLDNTTEALMVDVELTLRRLRNRTAASTR